MRPNSPATTRRAGQHAALRRLQRAQLAEARRIRRVVADAYTLTPALLRCPRRPATLAEARQVAMWLMRTRLRWPLPARTTTFPCARIGRLLGGRDHATVRTASRSSPSAWPVTERRTPICARSSAPSARRLTPPMKPGGGPTNAPRSEET